MLCPTCAKPFRVIQYEGVSIHTCDRCGGEFVGPEELAEIVNKRETVFGPALRDLYQDHQPMFGVPEGADERNLQCPACEGDMQIVNYGGDSGVIVDRCEVCGGVWLDREELEKIQVIMENWQDQAPLKLTAIAGELERARRSAAEACKSNFAPSRFSFVNAVLNRLLDAA